MRSSSPGRAVQGSALLEVMLALTVAALLGFLGLRQALEDAEDSTAVATAHYLQTVADASQRLVLTHFQAYAQGQTVPGLAQPTQPTLDELMVAGRLATGFPSLAPNRQGARIDVVARSCPGTQCTLTALVCTQGAFALNGRVRDDLATVALVALNGRGARSHAAAPDVVRGPAAVWPNPAGAVAGVVCAQNYTDTALFDQFVRVADTRDPHLQGALSVGAFLVPSQGPAQTVAAGDVCSDPVGALRSDPGGRLLSCQGGFWRAPDGGKTYAMRSPVVNVPGGQSFAVDNCPTGSQPWATYAGQTSASNLTVIPPLQTLVYSVQRVGNVWLTQTQASAAGGAAVVVNGNLATLGIVPVGVFSSGCADP